MKLGILYYSGTKKQDSIKLPINNSLDISDFSVFSENYAQVQSLESFEDLEKDVFWLSNIKGKDALETISAAWKNYYDLTVVTQEWLDPKLEILANKISAKLPEELDLVLQLILRLINLVENINEKKISFSEPLISQIYFESKQNSEIIKNTIPELNNFFIDRTFNGIKLPLSLDPNKEYRKVDVHAVDIMQIILSCKYPEMDKWQRIDIKNLNDRDYDFSIFAIDPNSIELIALNQDLPLLDAIKETFLVPKKGNELIWINNHEFDVINQYYDFKIVQAYGNNNSCNLDIGIVYNSLDYLSVTKNWLAFLQLKSLVYQTSAQGLWAKTILLKELFLKAITIFDSLIELTFFDFLCFHFQCDQNKLDDCFFISIENGLQPNVAIFR
jgi:hypothetical protein